MSSRKSIGMRRSALSGCPAPSETHHHRDVECRIERSDKMESERRFFISSRALCAADFARATRGHWAIENNLHWSVDTTFGEDLSRLRTANMAMVRHFALNLVRQVADKRLFAPVRNRLILPACCKNSNSS
jgi:hypothetical protein